MRGSPASLLVLLLSSGCGPQATAGGPSTAVLAVAESLYLELRDVRDRIDVAQAAARQVGSDGTPVATLAQRHDELRRTVGERLAAVDSAALPAGDRRALGVMRRALAGPLAPLPGLAASGRSSTQERPDCAYDPASIARGEGGLDSLRARIYACYGWAQHHIAVGADTIDRLTVYGELARTASREDRRRLFLALEPVWRSINADNGAASPYRTLIALEAARHHGELPVAQEARRSGLHPDSLEPWLTAILAAWRDAASDSVIEPWDWYYLGGAPARALGGRVPRERLSALNAEIYRAVGADVGALNVRYDLEPREGKTPVAFCTFGARPRLVRGRWTPGEPSVFATYRTGGLDNLAELLHETGHAVHIAAIRTRPAFTDWPDSDPFTEAVADFVALDVAEPAWQQRWLGDSVPLADGLRSRYGSIVLDVAWSLFELHMLRHPADDPNRVWSRLTHEYLRVRPHPELSWWAMRGQLVDSPGYMMNYAVGAILIAALRARAVEVHGPFLLGDTTWYPWVSRTLLRFGLERPTSEVIEEFLGGPVTPAALLKDMARMKP
ncbi:MAG TPA: hypothetical protein VHG35_18935 [Gemmatimonadales bacterium]|nr:hypothetical protein [Gemmatimonadales bacterium]